MSCCLVTGCDGGWLSSAELSCQACKAGMRVWMIWGSVWIAWSEFSSLVSASSQVSWESGWGHRRMCWGSSVWLQMGQQSWSCFPHWSSLVRIPSGRMYVWRFVVVEKVVGRQWLSLERASRLECGWGGSIYWTSIR